MNNTKSQKRENNICDWPPFIKITASKPTWTQGLVQCCVIWYQTSSIAFYISDISSAGGLIAIYALMHMIPQLLYVLQVRSGDSKWQRSSLLCGFRMVGFSQKGFGDGWRCPVPIMDIATPCSSTSAKFIRIIAYHFCITLASFMIELKFDMEKWVPNFCPIFFQWGISDTPGKMSVFERWSKSPDLTWPCTNITYAWKADV